MTTRIPPVDQLISSEDIRNSRGSIQHLSGLCYKKEMSYVVSARLRLNGYVPRLMSEDSLEAVAIRQLDQ